MARIGVVGCGSIGSVLAQGFAKLGHEVFINDVDEERIEELPFEYRGKSWLSQYTDYVVFALPTPTKDHGGDASIVNEALHAFTDTDATLILRSTMPPGSTQRLADTHDLPLVYSPEFLRDRSGVDDFFTPDRMVFAGPKPQVQDAKSLFQSDKIKCDTVFVTEDYLTAEIAKEAHNTFFATKVSFANQMRVVCEECGADPEMVMNVITADARNTDSHLDPLLGPYGGKCLPKDTEALTKYANRKNAPTPLLDGTIRMNQEAKRRYQDIEIQGNWPDVEAQGD